MEIIPLNLANIYQSIKNTNDSVLGLPSLPERNDNAYKQYLSTYSSLIESVPDTPGVYLWLSKLNPLNIQYIYVGESGRKKQGLRTRFKDEFKKWHHCFWATAFGSDKYLSEAIRIYVESGRYTPHKTYSNEICANWLKRGATHLLYYTNDEPNLNFKETRRPYSTLRKSYWQYCR